MQHGGWIEGQNSRSAIRGKYVYVQVRLLLAISAIRGAENYFIYAPPSRRDRRALIDRIIWDDRILVYHVFTLYYIGSSVYLSR